MGVLSVLFGKKDPEIKKALDAGAIIIDVRTAGEFASGNIPGSINMPLQSLPGSVKNLKDKKKPVITVCASGMRSGAAKKILESNGFMVINGGSWLSVKSMIS